MVRLAGAGFECQQSLTPIMCFRKGIDCVSSEAYCRSHALLVAFGGELLLVYLAA